MIILRGNDATAYDAPRHFGMRAYRLHGGDIDAFKDQVGLSVFDPGGGAEHGASTADRVYIVVTGEMTVTSDGKEHILAAHDSCYIPAGEERSLMNNGILPVILITIIAQR